MWAQNHKESLQTIHTGIYHTRLTEDNCGTKTTLHCHKLWIQKNWQTFESDRRVSVVQWTECLSEFHVLYLSSRVCIYATISVSPTTLCCHRTSSSVHRNCTNTCTQKSKSTIIITIYFLVKWKSKLTLKEKNCTYDIHIQIKIQIIIRV